MFFLNWQTQLILKPLIIPNWIYLQSTCQWPQSLFCLILNAEEVVYEIEEKNPLGCLVLGTRLFGISIVMVDLQKTIYTPGGLGLWFLIRDYASV